MESLIGSIANITILATLPLMSSSHLHPLAIIHQERLYQVVIQPSTIFKRCAFLRLTILCLYHSNSSKRAQRSTISFIITWRPWPGFNIDNSCLHFRETELTHLLFRLNHSETARVWIAINQPRMLYTKRTRIPRRKGDKNHGDEYEERYLPEEGALVWMRTRLLGSLVWRG